MKVAGKSSRPLVESSERERDRLHCGDGQLCFVITVARPCRVKGGDDEYRERQRGNDEGEAHPPRSRQVLDRLTDEIAFDSTHRQNAKVCRQLGKLIAEREQNARIAGRETINTVAVWDGAKGIDEVFLQNLSLRVISTVEWVRPSRVSRLKKSKRCGRRCRLPPQRVIELSKEQLPRMSFFVVGS
jgi:hypothetical protein